MPRIEISVKLNEDVPYAMLDVLHKLRSALEEIRLNRLIEDFSIALPEAYTVIVSFTEE